MKGGYDFGDRLKSHTILAGEPLVRIHQSVKSPVWFGPAPSNPPANRFDAPGGQYRTLYAATDLRGAYVETVLHRPAGRLVKRAYVEARSFSTLRPTRDLTMAMLYGPGLIFHNAPAALGSGLDYNTSRAFALALFEQFTDLDGLIYRSSHNDDELCVALFDRVKETALPIVETTPLLAVPDKIDAIMAAHGAAFDTSSPLPDLKDLSLEHARVR